MYGEMPHCSDLLSVRVKCTESKKTFTIPADKIEWTSNEGECDMCGSHGELSFEFDCKYCVTKHKKPRVVRHKIYLESW